MSRSGIVALSTAVASLLAACGGGGGSGTPSQPAPQISALTISPQYVFLTAGTTEQLSATAMLTDGSTKPETPVWSSSSPSIADVSTGGGVSAHTAGTTTITAQATGVTAVTTITVTPTFSTRTYQSGTLLILENTVGTDVVRLGMDLSLGGAVSELSLNSADVVAKETNVGSHLIAVGLQDANRLADTNLNPDWVPIESCDTYRHGSPTLAQSMTGDTIYIKSNAVESHPDTKGGGPTHPVLSDIIIERWFSPVPNHPYAFQERYKLTHTGNDRHAGAINAVPSYEITAILDRMVYYTGTSPGVAATPTTLLGSQMPQWPLTQNGRLWLSERWGAFTNPQGYGFLGYIPQAFPYAGEAIANNNPAVYNGIGFGFDTPFSFLPGTTVEFDTFLMLGDVATMQRETYDIKRRLGPFPDVSAPMGDLGTPVDGSTVSGIVSVSGWAFDSESDTSVTLYVDDALVASGSVNMNRPDINTAYPGSPANTAYQFDLDTTRFANGSHAIEVRAADAAGNVQLLPHHVVTIRN